MEVVLSAVASDIVGRLVSFLIGKFHEPASTDDDVVVKLQRALLRARVVVEEAEARQVTNRAMLLQLHRLRGEMCRGSYVLDAFTRRAVDPSRGSHAMASWSPAGLPERLESGRTGGQVVSAVVNTLEAALNDMKEEFVVLLGACPRLNRQPYCAYLFMERCMFGRQMEKEQIIRFLRKISMSSRSLVLTRSGNGRWSSMPVSTRGCGVTSPRFITSEVTILIYYRAMTTMTTMIIINIKV